MPFIKPMLASPLKRKPDFSKPNTWAVEEKFDGHRIVVEVGFGAEPTAINTVKAWSRVGNVRPLPNHLVKEFQKLPCGTYDGELYVPGKRCYGTKELANGPELRFVMFDILHIWTKELGDLFTDQQTYDARRQMLEEIFKQAVFDHEILHLSKSIHVNDLASVFAILDQVWAKDGEGLILKRRDSKYAVGKRPAHIWIKFKREQSDVVTVVGFLPSTGELQDRGPYGRTVVRASNGVEFSLKTINDKTLEELERVGKDKDIHPYIGRKLRIEFQERTPDGAYREPRWDRWEDQ